MQSLTGHAKRKVKSLDALTETGLEFGSDDEVKQTENSIDAREAAKFIDDLPDKYRDILYFRYVEDLSIQEIADITGERENTVSVRVHRGVKMIEELFNQKQS